MIAPAVMLIKRINIPSLHLLTLHGKYCGTRRARNGEVFLNSDAASAISDPPTRSKEHHRMKTTFLTLLILVNTTAIAQPSAEMVCSYAPSQSNKVAAVTGAAGATVTAGALAAATGLTATAVAHSSGALILTGASGYIGGTIGATAVAVAAVPVIVAVGLVVGGTAVTVELVCANRNHPEQVARIYAAAEEFSLRFASAMDRTKVAADDMEKSVVPAADRAAVRATQVASDVWEYAYQKSAKLGQVFRK